MSVRGVQKIMELEVEEGGGPVEEDRVPVHSMSDGGNDLGC